jgi:hypothetical protein
MARQTGILDGPNGWNVAIILSQMKLSGVEATNNSHMERSAEKLSHILWRLERQLNGGTARFQPDCFSIQDIFLAALV